MTVEGQRRVCSHCSTSTTRPFDLDGRQGLVSFQFYIYELFIVKLFFFIFSRLRLLSCAVFFLCFAVFPKWQPNEMLPNLIYLASNHLAIVHRKCFQSGCQHHYTKKIGWHLSDSKGWYWPCVSSLWSAKIHQCFRKLLPQWGRSKVKCKWGWKIFSGCCLVNSSFPLDLRVGHLTVRPPENDSDSSLARWICEISALDSRRSSCCAVFIYLFIYLLCASLANVNLNELSSLPPPVPEKWLAGLIENLNLKTSPHRDAPLVRGGRLWPCVVLILGCRVNGVRHGF